MQINRPLIWILASYLAGILLMSFGAKKKSTSNLDAVFEKTKSMSIGETIGIIIVGSMIVIIVLQMLYLHKKKSKISSYYFLFFLPFFFILGFFRTSEQLKPAIFDSTFDEKIETTLWGELITIEDKGEYQRLTLKEVKINDRNHNPTFIRSKVLVYNSNITQFKLGNLLKVSGTLQKFQIATNPGQFNEYVYYRNKKFDYKINAKKVTIENSEYNIFYDRIYRLNLKFQSVYNSILDEKQSGILSAMILGDTNSLDEEVNELYKQNGISHIIAISGLHVSLLGLTLFNLLRRLRIPMLPSTIASVFLLYAYGILTGFSVSTNRSIVMLVIYMISLLVGRTYDLLSGTALSAILILLQNPMEIFNAGFLLSFGAIVAVGGIFPILKKLIPIQNTILHSFLMCIAIQFVTTPILLYYFYEIPTFSVFINLIIIPLSSLVILLAVVAVLLGSIYLPLGIFFIGGAHFLLIFFDGVCKLALHLPFRQLLIGRPDTITLVAYFMALAIFLLLNQKKLKKLSLIVLLFSGVIFLKPVSAEMEITFLDVGQGDGIVLNLPDNTTFLIDGGSTNISKIGKYRIESFLRFKGIKVIDYAIVTHTDKDHISGLLELMEAMKDWDSVEKENKENKENKDYINSQILIRNLVLPSTSLKDEAYNYLVILAAKKGIPCLYIQKGDVFELDDLIITCLHPSEKYKPKSKNDYSTVLSLTYKDFDLLLTGDLEANGEELVNAELKKRGGFAKSYDILKVAHHGSKYSTMAEFLEIVSPGFSIISCGKKNSYGHPHKELLDRLKNCGSEYYITYESGAITILTNGEKMQLREYVNQ